MICVDTLDLLDFRLILDARRIVTKILAL